MKDILNLMKQAKEMQSKMATMQEELAEAVAEGAAGAGLVTVTMNGKGAIVGVSIDPSLMKEGENEIVEDLIMAAHNDAKRKIEEITAQKTQELTAGLPLPPGMKLPF